jgi:hypothetical protein
MYNMNHLAIFIIYRRGILGWADMEAKIGILLIGRGVDWLL